MRLPGRVCGNTGNGICSPLFDFDFDCDWRKKCFVGMNLVTRIKEGEGIDSSGYFINMIV